MEWVACADFYDWNVDGKSFDDEGDFVADVLIAMLGFSMVDL